MDNDTILDEDFSAIPQGKAIWTGKPSASPLRLFSHSIPTWLLLLVAIPIIIIILFVRLRFLILSTAICSLYIYLKRVSNAMKKVEYGLFENGIRIDQRAIGGKDLFFSHREIESLDLYKRDGYYELQLDLFDDDKKIKSVLFWKREEEPQLKCLEIPERMAWLIQRSHKGLAPAQKATLIELSKKESQ